MSVPPKDRSPANISGASPKISLPPSPAPPGRVPSKCLRTTSLGSSAKRYNTTMDRHTPPSPTPTKVEPMPSGFNELLQHNSSAPYPGQPIPTTESIPPHLQPGSRYGTPGPQLQHSQGIEAPMLYQQGGTGDMVRIHRRRRVFRRLTCFQQTYHQQMAYTQHNSPYGPVPEVSRRVPGQIKPCGC